MRHQKVARSGAMAIFPDLVPAGKSIVRGSGRDIAVPDSRFESMHKTVPIGSVRHASLSFSNIHQHGELFVDFMRARRQVFIDRLGWNLPASDGMEFDQYDTPLCRWVVLHEYGQVLGGIRLIPTTAACGIYSYMLRDAQRGLLPDIPNDILFLDAPRDPRVVEASRLFIVDAVPARRRAEVQRDLMRAMGEVAMDMGASRVIGIVPWVFARWLKRIGLSAVPVGRRFSIDGTQSQAALFNLARNQLLLPHAA